VHNDRHTINTAIAGKQVLIPPEDFFVGLGWNFLLQLH
jgi:hypothetical protein